MNTSPPYASLAPIYDRVMAHVEYHSWLRLIKTVVSRYIGSSPVSVFEVGGGTGVLARMLRSEGFDYYGSDHSLAMCQEARKKGLPFFCADARRLPLKSAFDLLLFLYDGINYMLRPGDYARFLTEAYSCLSPSGHVLFDITTEANSIAYFSDFLDFEDFGSCAYVRHSYYEAATRNQHNDFTIWAYHSQDNGRSLFEKHEERHVQRVLPAEEVRDEIPADLFSVVGIWDGFTQKRYTSRSKRIHFLLKKKD